jgi:opacity protein-like surface antigen
MKKRILFFTICFFLILYASAALAGNVYISGNLGAVFLNDSDLSLSDGTKGKAEYDTGFGITGAVGYDFGPARLEGEVGYRANGYDTVGASGQEKANAGGDVTGWDFMLNGYFDLENTTPFTPYIGGGIGAAVLDSSAINAGGINMSSGDDTVFAYQIIAGAAYTFADVWALQLEYRFFGTADPTYNSTDSEYMSHNVFVGIRFNF